jgi:ribosomal protein S1
MFLQSIVESKEEKGYFLNLGFKDGAKGFLKFVTGVTYEIGDLVNVVVISSTSKLVKCSTDIMSCVQSTESVLVTEHTMKAGFLVNSKVAKIYENGIEISFLGGMTGTVFVDHTGRENVSKFKVGERLQARCISHDVSTKTTTMSLLPHILSLSPKEMCEPGSTFEKVKVYKKVFGDSYLIKLPGAEGEQIAFLHKSHLPGAK